MPHTRALHVHRSNRTERLVHALGDILEEPAGGPLEPECIVVQGRGMALWLMHELAKRNGIFANADFPFPRRFVERAFQAVLGAPSLAANLGSSELLRFMVLAELDAQLDTADFAKLRRYVADDAEGLRRFELAHHIARVFDQYLVYRPELVLGWEQGNDGDIPQDQAWQPSLFRALGPRFGGIHAAALETRFRQELGAREPGTPIAGLPGRVVLFGLTSLPPLYLRVICALARHLELHLFLLSATPDPAAQTNSLLASLGRVTAELEQVLSAELDQAGVALERHDAYEPPLVHSVLGRLASDLFGAADERATPAPGDDSITLHACHSPMREVEVLRDRLLDALAADPTLEPRDIVVMLPDVDAYAPLIEAVFTREPGDPTSIPFRISDRALRQESPVVEALHRLLALVGGRLGASDVLDLLRLDPVRRRFGIQADELDQITDWVIESGIRWGVDEAHRSAHGQPALAENTWRFGLERLLLGYAMRGQGFRLFGGSLPYDEVEGQDAELAGKFAEFVERLFAELEALKRARPLPEWQGALATTLERMIHTSPLLAWQQQRVLSAVARLSATAESAGFSGTLSLDVVRRLLDEALDDSVEARGFLAGGVTFCAMLPMRSIPFRVVCLLGMSDGEFPREQRGVDFDLMRRESPRPGDRSRRDDDRLSFLEALLSARERLIVSYVGQSIQDNTKKPPSVLVSELGEHLLARLGVELPFSERRALEERLEHWHPPLFVRHPLQSFSPRYFDGADSRLFSYSAEHLAGARSLLPERAPAPPLFDATLPGVEPAQARTINVGELFRFFEGPIIWLLNRRLGVSLRERDVDVPDREPCELRGLDKWGVATRLLELGLSEDLSDSYQIARATGQLPPGAAGRREYEDVESEVRIVEQLVKEARGPERVSSLSIHRILPGGTRLSGELASRWSNGLVLHHYSRFRGKYLLVAWLKHLLSSWCAPDDAPKRTTLIARSGDKSKRPERWRFDAVSAPETELSRLVELFDAGQTRPLLLLPSASLAYASARREGETHEAALYAAKTSWNDGHRLAYKPAGEGDDPHYKRIFGEEWRPGMPPPFIVDGPSFEELAERIFEPLLAHVERVR